MGNMTQPNEIDDTTSNDGFTVSRIRRISQKHRLSIRELNMRRSSFGGFTKNNNNNSSTTWSKVSNFFITSLQDEVNADENATSVEKNKIKNKDANTRRRGTKKRNSVKKDFTPPLQTKMI